MDKKTLDIPIIKSIEDLIKKSSGIPHHEVIKIMMKTENNPSIDVKKELSILSKKYKK